MWNTCELYNQAIIGKISLRKLNKIINKFHNKKQELNDKNVQINFPFYISEIKLEFHNFAIINVSSIIKGPVLEQTNKWYTHSTHILTGISLWNIVYQNLRPISCR